jgi:nicotinamidase-related amidase
VREATPGFVRFLNDMRAHKCHIVHLQLINLPDDPNAERYNGHLPVAKGSQGAAILPEFLKDSDIVMEKNKDSGFYETDLHERLQKLGVDTVVITGMQTQICVQTTAADAFFRGYNVWVPENAVVSAFKEDKDRALTWLASYCATVSTTEEIAKIIAQDGSLPRKAVATP